MLHSSQLLILYTRVLEDTSFVNKVSEKDMKQAIEHMHKIYQGSSNSLSKKLNYLTDFNEVTYRCAYLFKYAPFHTALSYTAMSHVLTESPYEIREALNSLSGPLKLCSLGSGPGSDVIGVLAAMHDVFGFFPSSGKLVDIMSEWELTFWSIIDELRFGEQIYGSLSESVSERWFNWSFVSADLQNQMNGELTEVLETADLVTMIKFVSASACNETSSMIERIFRLLKPGAFVLFVDNAAGGFVELINNAANKYKLKAVSTPLKHQHYRNEAFNCPKYGYRSCYESKVAVQLLMKSNSSNCSNENNFTVNLSCERNLPSLSVPLRQKIQVPEFQNFRIGPKLVDNLANEYKILEPESLSNFQESNFFLSSDCSPKVNRLKIQTQNNMNLYKSYDSESSWGSRPYCSPNQTRSAWEENQIYNPEYQNESFGHELPLKAHNSNRIDLFDHHSFPSSCLQTVYAPKLQNFRTHPKPIGGPINEHDTFNRVALSSFPMSHVSSSSKFFSDLERMEMQAGYSTSHDKSFESKLTSSVPLNSSPQISSYQSRSVIFGDQICDYVHENDLFEGEQHCNTSINDRPLIVQASQIVSEPILYARATDDSGYSEESYERELFWDSPVFNNSFNTKFSPRQVKYMLPESKIDYAFNGDKSFWNTSADSLTQHSTVIPQAGNPSLSSVYYGPSLPELNQSTRMSFEKIDNSVYGQNPLNPGSSYQQTWRNDYDLLGALQYKSRQQKESTRKQSNNDPFSLKYRHSGKSKAPIKHCEVSVSKLKPNGIKRSLTKQSKQISLSSLRSRYCSEKFKALKRRYNVTVHQHKPNDTKRFLSKESKQSALSVRRCERTKQKESLKYKQIMDKTKEQPHRLPGGFKESKRHCSVPVH